jgi:hypothetical protein
VKKKPKKRKIDRPTFGGGERRDIRLKKSIRGGGRRDNEINRKPEGWQDFA